MEPERTGPSGSEPGHRQEYLAGSQNPIPLVSHGEGPTFDGPTKRLGHGVVEVRDERLDPVLEVHLGGEVAAAKQLAHENGEPDLDLIDPRRVLRREVEGDAMAGVAQEGLARRHGGENAGLALLAEIVGDAA